MQLSHAIGWVRTTTKRWKCQLFFIHIITHRWPILSVSPHRYTLEGWLHQSKYLYYINSYSKHITDLHHWSGYNIPEIYITKVVTWDKRFALQRWLQHRHINMICNQKRNTDGRMRLHSALSSGPNPHWQCILWREQK